MAQPMSQPPTADDTLDRRTVVGWRNAVFLIFAFNGIFLATWLARTPVIRDLLDASTATMGWIVFSLAAGSIVGLTFSSHLIAVGGTRTGILVGMAATGAGLVTAGCGAALLESRAVVVLGLFVFGFGTGLVDVSMNVEGAAAERALHRTIMPLFHACFSFGTMIGAGIGVLCEHLGVALVPQVLVLAALLVAITTVAVRRLRNDELLALGESVPTSETAASDELAVADAFAVAAPVGEPVGEPMTDPASAAAGGWRNRLAMWRDRRTLLIGLIVLGMAFAEGSANDWLALAIVDGHHVSNATGALVFALFVTAMTVGRVLGGPVLDRFGRVAVLRATGALAAVGLVVVIFVPNPVVAAAGVVVWGLGASLGFPVGMSAAADDPKTAAARVSAVATIGYCAFLVGPPVIGLLGQHVGLLHALLVVLLLVAVAALASGAAREAHRGRGTTGAVPVDATRTG